MTPWTIASHASLSMEFCRQEYWDRLPFLSPGNLPDPGFKAGSPALQSNYLRSEPSEEPSWLRGSKKNLLDKVELGENAASLIAQLIKNPLQCRRPWFDSWIRRIFWRRDSLPTPVFLAFPCGSVGKESTAMQETLI